MHKGYDTIRSICKISEDEHRALTEVLEKDDLAGNLRKFIGERIILIWDAEFSDKDEIYKGEFNSGIITKIEDSENRTNYAGSIRIGLVPDKKIGVFNLYDIILAETIRNDAPDDRDMNAYYFVAVNRTEEISNIVIHTDPVLAYGAIIERKRERYTNQFLMSVEQVQPGKIFQHRTEMKRPTEKI